MPSSSNNAVLQAVNALRAVPHLAWRGKVKRVAVVLTSSRSGSSLLKGVLASHEGIAAMDGEAEPYLALSANGFGFNGRGDAFTMPANAGLLADCIFDGLGIACGTISSLPALQSRWSRRLLLQFPALFTQADEYRRLHGALNETLDYALRYQHEMAERELQRIVLSAVYWREPWRLDYYDGRLGPGIAGYFNEPAKIEEPPFVLPSLFRRPFTVDDAEHKILLFKTPSDAYRIGLYEQLFPEADVRYIHLTRGFAQTVNGLMDGWQSPHGFFAHDMARQGHTLDIAGYSDRYPFGKRWWKFDLPPDWQALAAGSSLEKVCLHQWLSCHRAILDSGVPALRVSFEDFLAAPGDVSARIFDWLGLPALPQPPVLNVTMATEAPQPARWRKRRDLMLSLGQRADVAEMMDALGYRMEPEGWL
ncbi:MAG TPA: hypothetical protein VGF27_12720 [Pseudoduganella sp.]